MKRRRRGSGGNQQIQVRQRHWVAHCKVESFNKCEYRAAHPEGHVGALCADPWRLARGACCSLSGRAYHRRCNSDAEAVAAHADAAAAAAAAASASPLQPLPQPMLMMLPPIPLQRALHI